MKPVVKADFDHLFEHLSTKEGLSHGSISAMIQDRRGFMWFATWDGLNRYDGHTFKTFKPNTGSSKLSASNRIESIREDSFGNIWIITFDSRAFRLNRLTWEFNHVPGVFMEKDTARITGIYPLKSGDVWVTTRNTGVYRIITDSTTNTYTLSHYHAQSTVPIVGNHILFFKEDGHKNIWINTTQGLTCLEADTVNRNYRHRSFDPGGEALISQQRLTTFFETNNYQYFGTQKGSLLIFYHQTGTFFELDIRNEAPITNISGNNNGTLYLGTNGNGIFEYNETYGKITKHYNHPQIQTVLKTYPDSNGLLWIESSIAGISKINLKNGHFRHYEQLLDVNPDVRKGSQCGIMEDENQVVWLTLKGGGFGFFNPQTDDVEYFYNKPGDPESKLSNFVNCFYKDPNGVLWLSTYFKGLEKITFIKNKFRFFQPNPDVPLSVANEIRSLMQDSRGHLWVATKKQELYILNKNFDTLKKIENLNGSKIGPVYAITEDQHGNIWLGTKGNGLFRLTPASHLEFSVKHYLHDPQNPYSLSNNNIYSLLRGKPGQLWIGTYGGGLNLLVQDQFIHGGNQFKNYPKQKALKIRHISADTEGNLWIGTTDGLLWMPNSNQPFDQLQFELYNKESENCSGLMSNDIFWVYPDHKKKLWVASLGGGLSRIIMPFDKNKLEFLTITRKDGLPSDVIFTITNDRQGNLWMSTENGIALYNPDKNLFRHFNQYDGIKNTFFSESAIVKCADGELCFGSYNGIYALNPEILKEEQKKVPLVFTQFQLFGKEVEPGEKSVLNHAMSETESLTLQYNQNAFSIVWSALDFSIQDKITYACKLEGFDNDWIITGNRNQTDYTRLPPGEYRFWVKCTNPELLALNQPIALDIFIRPPYWKTGYAYAIYIVIALGLLELARRIFTTIIKLRHKAVLEGKLANLKIDFFTKISHELRTPLTLIIGPVQELKKEKISQKAAILTELIDQNATRLLHLVNQLLDFRKIQQDHPKLNLANVNINVFLKDICQSFEDLARRKNIDFSLNCPSHQIVATIDREKMESVVLNLLSNAFKFTPDRKTIEVSLTEIPEKNEVNIEVKDTGVGIPPDQIASLFKLFASHSPDTTDTIPGTGIGLALAKELVNLHEGELSYWPNPKGGAIFSIRLKHRMPSIPLPSIKAEAVIPDHPASPEKGDITHLTKTKPQILLVEDNPDLRIFVRLQLESDYLIEEASNGLEALKKIEVSQPDIIISDIMMPRMNGIQMLDRIKNNFDTSHIPVVLLSAKSSVESKIEGLKYGADAYLTKPFNKEQLSAQLENLLNQRIVLRQKYSSQSTFKTSLAVIHITGKDTAFLERVRQIIEENLTNPKFKTEDLYRKTGLGRTKFSEKIKGLTGLSPIDFVIEYRLNKAMNLLQSGSLNVTETCYTTGFSDAGYFSKCFKERFGVNPSRIKNLQAGKSNDA
ncbi:MAG: response regulator [Prolixibacteraceae bacterium]|nr:response regulator [Prolixibacteraceae bacterium]